MINLFYQLDKPSLEIYRSLKNVGIESKTVVIEDSGFLPSDITSPYQFFAKYHATKQDRPKFFNEIKIPKHWEIHGSNQFANVFNLGEIKANIKYHSHPQPRSVHRVEWLDKNQKVRFVDVYNQYGYRFMQEVRNADSQIVFKSYFNQQNEEIIYENIVTNQLILRWNGKEYIFDSKTKFVQFYLRESGLDTNVLNINSLGVPFFVSLGLDNGHTNIIWQEQIKEQIPGNMQHALTKTLNRSYKVLVPDQMEYNHVKVMSEQNENVIPFGYHYQFKRQNQGSRDVLIATNSDDLLHFEQIVKDCPEYTFHVAAMTEMSNTLIQYDRFENVILYPIASKYTFNKLFETCDYYLDINSGNELHGAVRRAFDMNMLILSFKGRAHNKTLTLPELTKDDASIEDFIKTLNQHLDQSVLNRSLALQIKHANHISKEAFIQALQ
ncbi:accessory Sec system glycosylation chaperone GtfB [Macrococcus sp. DPC7161]|uniref:accessory Sec system glycosylation chaperone GtfB n=1 Tax=Macrococcus sp. DPC7161 TaxID=2507060 RepID=UPI00100B04D6|nr:accessory Sec system glycosylation chaperone GtfB [Macrococcus sp. DPC7161]RXK17627.1 accessory Sec system glycosylation chaperone GtfB [Macrococcus sp. DPC7161]